jgi:hypothetical protein
MLHYGAFFGRHHDAFLFFLSFLRVVPLQTTTFSFNCSILSSTHAEYPVGMTRRIWDSQQKSIISCRIWHLER